MKNKYREFCKNELSLPIFLKDWWMDAVCGENWDAVVVENGGQVIAVLPYYLKKLFFFKVIMQPPLTQINGIWIRYPYGQKYDRKLAYEKEAFTQIIDGINSSCVTYFNQDFHYSISNWLPFLWKGFDQTTKYTYIIKDTSDLDKVYENFNPKIRTQIKKAEKYVTVEENFDLNIFYSVLSKTFARQGKSTPFSFDLLKRIDTACVNKKCRKILYAKDKNNNIHAVAYLVWDENSVYYLMGGGDPQYRNSEAATLILWKAIEFSSQIGKQFDFEGSIVENIEAFFRAFGATQTPYFNVSKVMRNKMVFMVLKTIYFKSGVLKKLLSQIIHKG